MRVYEGEKLIKKTIYIENEDFKYFEDYMKSKNLCFSGFVRMLMANAKKLSEESKNKKQDNKKESLEDLGNKDLNNFD